jgi:hypothetical protein
MGRLRGSYGASSLHLLAALASFAIAGYAFFRIVDSPSALGTIAWFAAAILAHDLIAFPLYSGLNLIASRGLGGGRERAARLVPVINHVRIPAFLAVLPLLLFFPEILGLDSRNYQRDTGLSPDVFLTRWLGLCATLFLGSALIYAVRLRRAKRPVAEEED